MSNLAIGDLARLSGVKVTTIRYYEGAGLMPAPPRTEGGRRAYTQAHARRLSFIRHARDLGFEMDDVRALLALSDDPNGPCSPVDDIAERRVAAVEAKIERLNALRDELVRLTKACQGGRIGDCHIIETLADHGLCSGDHQ